MNDLKKIYQTILSAGKKFDLDTSSQKIIARDLDYIESLSETDVEIVEFLHKIGNTVDKGKISKYLLLLRAGFLEYEPCLVDTRKLIKKMINSSMRTL